jgi:hypothetical protein
MLFREIESLTLQYLAMAREYQAATGTPPRRPHPLRNGSLVVIAAEMGLALPAELIQAPTSPPAPVLQVPSPSLTNEPVDRLPA